MKKILVFLFFLLHFQTKGQERTICYGLLNLDKDKNNGISFMEKFAAEGVNGAIFTLWWDRVYPTLNSTPNYEQLDNQIATAMRLNLKFGIRIQVGREINKIKGFWARGGAAEDQYNQMLSEAYITNGSFVNDTANVLINNFIKEVVTRYLPYHKQNKLLYISVVNSPTQEFGYNGSNSFDKPLVTSIFDYSGVFRNKFKKYLEEKYTNVKTLNSLCGTNFRSINESFPFFNYGDVKNSFFGRYGKDWYYFRHKMLKEYSLMHIETIKNIDKTIKVINEYGGILDGSSALRGTVAFSDLSQNADAIKTGLDGFQGDFLISNLDPKIEISSETANWDPDLKQFREKLIEKYMTYRCKMFILYFEYGPKQTYEEYLPIIRKAVSYKNIGHQPLVFKDSMSVLSTEILEKQPFIYEKWNKLSEAGKYNIKIKYTEDILQEGKKILNPLQEDNSNNQSPNNPREGNINPIINIQNFELSAIAGEAFRVPLPNNLFYDSDGYIAFVEVLQKPDYLNFILYENSLIGKSNDIRRDKIKLKLIDNDGGFSIIELFISITKASVRHEIIEAKYFSDGVNNFGYLSNNRVLYQEQLPEKMSLLASVNIDSVYIKFDLNGPLVSTTYSYYKPFTLFTEGQGKRFPLGKYVLISSILKKNKIISRDTINFIIQTKDINNIPKSGIIYPNPSSSVFNVRLNEKLNMGEVIVTLFSMNGNEITFSSDELDIFDNTLYVNVSSPKFASGIYLLKIEKSSGEILYQSKIVKN